MIEPTLLDSGYLDGMGEVDAYVAGEALIVVPAINPAWPVEIRQAVDRRRRATLTGRCACGETGGPLAGGGGIQAVRGQINAYGFEHADACTATDEHLGALFRRAGLNPIARFR